MGLYAYSDIHNRHDQVDRGVSLVPSLSATPEFWVRSNSYDAQYGRLGGDVTSVIVKSGTNAVHGELYEFLKNVKLDAAEWVLNKARRATNSKIVRGRRS